jgi:hypothetical protein
MFFVADLATENGPYVSIKDPLGLPTIRRARTCMQCTWDFWNAGTHLRARIDQTIQHNRMSSFLYGTEGH